ALLADPERAAFLAAHALRHVQEHCSWDAVAASFLAQCPGPTVGLPSSAGPAGHTA
ncbi:MAG: hypothetical protein JO203_15065, partial [Gammaproteobacteria bacterium]|nr:hypothetical protein [Gammaproteobacteria bacterium]